MNRREWGVTRLAKELGINHGTVSQWLSGERRPSPASLDLIADRLVTNYDELLDLAGHRPAMPAEGLDATHARLDPRLQRIQWTESRYRMIEAILDHMRDDDTAVANGEEQEIASGVGVKGQTSGIGL